MLNDNFRDAFPMFLEIYLLGGKFISFTMKMLWCDIVKILRTCNGIHFIKIISRWDSLRVKLCLISEFPLSFVCLHGFVKKGLICVSPSTSTRPYGPCNLNNNMLITIWNSNCWKVHYCLFGWALKMFACVSH